MSEDIRFLVMVTAGNHVRPHFVKAANPSAARYKVLETTEYLTNCPRVTMDVFVLGLSELEPVIPDSREVARRYWVEGIRSTGYNGTIALAPFDELWDEMGADPGDDE